MGAARAETDDALNAELENLRDGSSKDVRTQVQRRAPRVGPWVTMYPVAGARPSISAEMLADAVESAPDTCAEPAFCQRILSAGSRAWIRLASRWSGVGYQSMHTTGVQRQTPQGTRRLAARFIGHLELHHKRCALVVGISVHATVRTPADTVHRGSLHSASPVRTTMACWMNERTKTRVNQSVTLPSKEHPNE